jgi:CheY-like chemotaxis protein
MAFFNENYSGIDLAIIDLIMPGMTGVQMAARIRRLEPDFPIIVMIGAIETDTIDHNVTRFLHKPIMKAELFEAIESLIGPVDNPPPEKEVRT